MTLEEARRYNETERRTRNVSQLRRRVSDADVALVKAIDAAYNLEEWELKAALVETREKLTMARLRVNAVHAAKMESRRAER